MRLSRAKGFNLQAASKALNGLPAVKVDRSTRWGNPFVVGRDGTRAQCVQQFRMLLGAGFCLSTKAMIEEQEAYNAYAVEHIATLRGKNLACWCLLPKDGEPDQCHAAVLLQVANQRSEERE